MRILLVSFALLATLCFAGSSDVEWKQPEELDISEEPIRKYWEEATNSYKEQNFQQFLNGNLHSRRRRHTKSNPFSEELNENWNIFEKFSDILASTHNISKRQAASIPGAVQCANPSVTCPSSRFRTYDGTCNNVANPGWGATNRAIGRILRPVYDDGFNTPKGGLNSRLPNPRLISTTIDPDSTAVDSVVSNMVPQFGQFLDHDISLTPNSPTPCCANPNNDVNCWTIDVSQDSFYAGNTQCLEFTRSIPCIRNGQREQMNAITAYIDGSQIYGSTVATANRLRSFSRGMLVTNPSYPGYLPFRTTVGIQGQGNFAAGDERVNEMPTLSVLHNVWLKEHNRIASWFSANTNWNDEAIYQETRRIVIAELQQVTYNEYLPIILGPAAMTQYNLGVSARSNYQANVDATILNEFATASYRFGHSMVSGLVELIDETNAQVDSFLIADEYFQSRQITRDNGQGYDWILRGLMRQNSPSMDRFATTGVTNFLFKGQNATFGSDLLARNIQRGRDHGLQSWNAYRVFCNGSDISTATWSAVPQGINAAGWAQAATVYDSPADIDLFIGALLEEPISGGLTGLTFTCLNALQFTRTKFGDRFFFTHAYVNSGFAPIQVTEISRRTFGDIICENSIQPDTQANVFLAPGPSNPTVPCGSDRPAINLRNYIRNFT